MATAEFMRDRLQSGLEEEIVAPDAETTFKLRFGRGNWRYFHLLDLDLVELLAEAERWGAALDDISHPWLCWNISHDWCLVQQKLARSVGWTPVVGYDPRVGAPRHLVDEAIAIDFNERLQLPVLQMHFVLDFAFTMVPRLAFWHSDLLCRPETMRWLGARFRGLGDGELAIVKPQGTRWERLIGRTRRYAEFVGCVTRDASRQNFDVGCGFWRGFCFHPNCPDAREFRRRSRRYWDFGSGLKYWRDRYRGEIAEIPERLIDEGHHSRISPINNKSFVPRTAGDQRHSGTDLEANVSLAEACRRLGLETLFDEVEAVA